MDVATDYEFELLVFRYIEKTKAKDFLAQMTDWGISVLSTPGTHGSHSAPAQYWDYPDFDRETKDVRSVTTKVSETGAFGRIALELIRLELISIRETPKHYPFSYVLEFGFKGKLAKKNSKEQMLHQLIDRTREAKQFTNALCGNAPYRPVYWFLREFPDDLRGMRGALNQVLSPDGTRIQVERVFPEASYAIYGTGPGYEDLRTTDLALVSVVAHAVERGFRGQMYSLTSDIYDKVRNVPITSELPKSVPELSERIERLYKIQQEIRPKADEFFEIRKHLIRIKGLVQRVRQVCGGTQDKNLFDLVCDDAITSIEDEIVMSQEEISTRLQEVGERLQTVYRQLNDHYGQLNTQRTQNLQRIGLYLQATGAAFLAFQISNGLLPSLLSWTTHRSLLVLAITTLFFILTYFGLSKMLTEQPHR